MNLWKRFGRMARIERNTERIITALEESAIREKKMAVTDEDILQEVKGQSTVANSVLVIVQRLASENDPAKRQAILDTLKANRIPLEAAVLAGTPAGDPGGAGGGTPPEGEGTPGSAGTEMSDRDVKEAAGSTTLNKSSSR